MDCSVIIHAAVEAFGMNAKSDYFDSLNFGRARNHLNKPPPGFGNPNLSNLYRSHAHN